MDRRVALLGLSLLLSITAVPACADASKDQAAPSGEAHPAFQKRAERVAQAWQAATGKDAWQTGFVPLQALTVPPAGEPFNDATERAFRAGWYRLQVGMPRERGGQTGTIRYPDGATATVPLVTRAEAYDELDQGDPPPCAGPTIPPGADAPPADGPAADPPPGRPESPTSDRAPKSCAALTVTGITLGSTPLVTSRGEARVPAWLFTVRELDGPVARVAVAPSAVTEVPELTPGELPEVPGLVAAQHLTGVDGTTLSYQLGVGACDEDITALWHETDDVVVVAGSVVRGEQVCTEQLILHPVRVNLDEPPGTRPVLDGVTGQVLTIPATPVE